MNAPPWSQPVRLSDLGRGPQTRTLTADPDALQRVAAALDLVEVSDLTAEVELIPWHDGAILSASWGAQVVQTCGVTLDPLPSSLAGEFQIRAVPEGSPMAPSEAGALELDLDAPDPPDVLEADRIDPAAYVVEHLALELDPFPRKPDAVFEPPEAEPETSPFAALLELKPLD